MQLFSRLKNRKTTLKRKLLLNMLALAAIVLSILALGLYLLGHFSFTKETISNKLSFQSNIFKHQTSKYFEDLTMMGVSLSKSVSEITTDYLDEKGITIDDVTDNQTHIKALEFAVFDLLAEEMFKTSCSGSFIIFNTTVNTSRPDYNNLKAGIYIQRSTLDVTDRQVVLVRGHSDLCAAKHIMPHRQWRLEFDTSLIPNYNAVYAQAGNPIEKTLCLSDVFGLQNTSEKVMLLMVPVFSENGNTFYGFCGFEITENYFRQYFAQASQIDQLTVLFTKKQPNNEIAVQQGFSAGVFGGYYSAPKENLSIKDFGNGLSLLTGKKTYVALNTDIVLCNQDYLLTAMFPKHNYDKMVMTNTAQMSLLTAFILFTTAVCCIVLSRRFLSPVLKGLEQIHKQKHKETSSEIIEINDLFAYLAEQDELKEKETVDLRLSVKEHKEIIENQKNTLEKLGGIRKNETNPEDYEAFKIGLKSLTKTEKYIFDLYLGGKTASDILSICIIQESTLKYHNHNILEKLGVSSRKQMLIYAALLEKEQKNDVGN